MVENKLLSGTELSADVNRMFSFLRRSTPARRTIEAIYGMIVAQARQPAFYTQFGVPDTVNGRFDMVVLHLWLVLRRLRGPDESIQLAQTIFDRFCDDMDDNLREMGVGDLAVPKRMKAFGEAFYGRTAAYDAAIAGQSTDDLAIAFNRNIYNGVDISNAQQLASYVRRTAIDLDQAELAVLSAGHWPHPPRETYE